MTAPPPKRPREALLLYAITSLVTVGLTLMQGSLGFLRGGLLVIVAATFLYLPVEVLLRRGEDPEDFGIHRHQLPRSLLYALKVMALTFPAYLVGFHVWKTQVLRHDLAPAEARFDRFPVELEDAPPPELPIREGEVRLYAERDQVTAHWDLPLGQRLTLDVLSDLEVVPSPSGLPAQREGTGLRYAGPADGFARFRVPGEWFEVSIEAGGDLLPTERLKLGMAALSADDQPYRAKRSYLWLLNLLLVQILLVALPEEVFYRGYLQGRFDALFPRRRRIFGVEVSVGSLLLTSALFGLGHFLVIPSPARLAVFFPSLIFGYMRTATGGIAACVVYHAACNVLVELASNFYR